MKSYKVWCLTWGDTENDACTVSEVNVRSGLVWTMRQITTYQCPSAADAAERCADVWHNLRDGWEAAWPLTFRVKDEAGVETDFSVEREVVPSFRAHAVPRES